jgi:hypothetical protein
MKIIYDSDILGLRSADSGALQMYAFPRVCLPAKLVAEAAKLKIQPDEVDIYAGFNTQCAVFMTDLHWLWNALDLIMSCLFGACC